ncbi:dioxygenase [Sorangium cellulosum So ce56]|uniref:Dioxygenase n=1 Tax=Sorangium cellulosum (strain So ce56) TaxID=448385 RepID=A9GLS6_SORC5|nr:dioxygenase [Sorangium cellulosum]CAN90316.1 dioxygenase [Sorangium cellulosum So ce56]
MKEGARFSTIPTRDDGRPTRRDVLTASLGGLGLTALGLGGLISKQLFAQPLVYDLPAPAPPDVVVAPTPACVEQPQTDSMEEGPFYAPNTPLKTDFRRPGHRGRELVLRGRVLDVRCRPIPGAVIDLWQADENALYDNIDYGYRGHQFTGPGGEFEVSTVFPKGYSILGLARSPHIHAKVQGAKTKLLTTQIFFPEDAESHARDPRFNPRLVADLRRTASGSPVATFDFVLEDA